MTEFEVTLKISALRAGYVADIRAAREYNREGDHECARYCLTYASEKRSAIRALRKY